MPVSRTWRHYLGQLLVDPGKRQQISEALAVSQITLQRWVNGKSPPRWRTLYRLLQILPDEHEHLLPLICEEFPDFSAFPSLIGNKSEAPSIPSAFYRRVMRTKACTPSPLLLTSLISLLEAYADLLALTFPSQQFYEAGHIELAVMPRLSVQRPLQAVFRYRVLQRIQMAIQTNQILPVLQAEQEVWQQLEQEFLQLLESEPRCTTEEGSYL